jgi:acetyl-CoA acetyltransferase
MRRVAVIGVGMTMFGKHNRTSAELFAEAAAAAILDADIAPSAVQALYYGNSPPPRWGSLPFQRRAWRPPAPLATRRSVTP